MRACVGGSLVHKLGDYMVSDSTLGQGTYAKVRLASNVHNNELYAMKIIKKPELEVKHYTRIKREVENLKGLLHPHIVQLHDVFQTKRFICIVMEYATGGDLYEYIQSQVGRFTCLPTLFKPHPLLAREETAPTRGPPYIPPNDRSSRSLPQRTRSSS